MSADHSVRQPQGAAALRHWMPHHTTSLVAVHGPWREPCSECRLVPPPISCREGVCLAGPQMESREKSLARGRSEIASLVSQLQIPGPLNLIESAHRYYVLALAKNFTRGRRTAQV